jgi:hypothetical protein
MANPLVILKEPRPSVEGGGPGLKNTYVQDR